ncbi:AraC-like DNA-binding protein [Tenacibaculum skagerrakense]|uniref:AraC-like DNA-binding protein n=1 Tax=Tenacibaculum skagerrakense TaxID=186571 RepID=A0A4R2NKR8_9FLAO|nr:helix-turn-helix domain-containing protein [Tenacibaculum skagerrakense]TCP22100.1 AraC-like DNA-binding protein [Tenacibaculum skagerrakense]
MKPIKEITFKNKKGNSYFFDLVSLEDILNLKPTDHNQYEHHKVAFYIIAIITEGAGKHSINYNEYTYEKGTVFTVRKNNIHKFYSENASGKFLVFTEDFIIQYSENYETLKLRQLFNEMLGTPKIQLHEKEFLETQNLLHHIESEFQKENDEYAIPIIRSLVQVLVLNLFRIKSKTHNYLNNSNYYVKFTQFQELIEKNCFEHKKVAYYADKLGVTPKTLNNITQNIIEKSAKSFIDEIVILQIKRLLVNSQLSLSEIAYETGFDLPTNFFKYFRKNTGQSPKEFKESQKK